MFLRVGRYRDILFRKPIFALYGLQLNIQVQRFKCLILIETIPKRDHKATICSTTSFKIENLDI